MLPVVIVTAEPKELGTSKVGWLSCEVDKDAELDREAACVIAWAVTSVAVRADRVNRVRNIIVLYLKMLFDSDI